MSNTNPEGGVKKARRLVEKRRAQLRDAESALAGAEERAAAKARAR
jgi:hypothetical protein